MPDRLGLLLVFIFFSITFYRMTVFQDLQFQTEDVVSRDALSLNISNSTHFRDFNPASHKWLNISGLTNDTGFAWSYLEDFKQETTNLSRYALGDQYNNKFLGQPAGDPLPLYQNVTGIARGGWTRKLGALQPPSLNMSLYMPRRADGSLSMASFGRNLSSIKGQVTIGIEEDEDPVHTEYRRTLDEQETLVARFAAAELEIESTVGGDDSWRVNLQGVHFLESGHLLLSTHSDKLSMLALPHFIDNPYYFQVAQRLISKVVNDTLSRSYFGRSMSRPEGFFDFPNCELIAYLQQQPTDIDIGSDAEEKADQISLLEHELRFPSGARTSNAPEIRFSMVAFSPDCGYVIESDGPPESFAALAHHLSGIPFEVRQLSARRHILLFSLIIGAQLFLLLRQMKESSTPPMLNRISFPTAGMLVLGDGFSTVLLAGISIIFPGLWVLLMATSCLGFLRMLFGAQMLMDVWTVQAPEYERREQRTTTTATAPSDVSVANQVTPDTLPLPVTTTRTIDTGAMPIFVTVNTINTPGSAEDRQSIGALYTGLYLVLTPVIFLAPIATQWPSTFRRIYFTALSTLYLSFWVPQILRNAVRNCRQALRWDFVIGQSILRLMPIAYLYGYESNVLFSAVHLVDLAFLALWVWIQCCVLASQQILGPRWFAKNEWLPPVYDYHVVLRDDEEGGNLPVGMSSNDPQSPASPTLNSKRRGSEANAAHTVDCAICMQGIEAPVMKSGDSSPPSSLVRRGYMLTPCRHIFHTKCLEGWMRYWNRGRLPCPICREELPSM